MEIKLQEESRKILYVDGVEVGQYKQNSHLKFLRTVEVAYGDLEQLYEGKATQIEINKV